jgi:hypothetical protein
VRARVTLEELPLRVAVHAKESEAIRGVRWAWNTGRRYSAHTGVAVVQQGDVHAFHACVCIGEEERGKSVPRRPVVTEGQGRFFGFLQEGTAGAVLS